MVNLNEYLLNFIILLIFTTIIVLIRNFPNIQSGGNFIYNVKKNLCKNIKTQNICNNLLCNWDEHNNTCN